YVQDWAIVYLISIAKYKCYNGKVLRIRNIIREAYIKITRPYISIGNVILWNQITENIGIRFKQYMFLWEIRNWIWEIYIIKIRITCSSLPSEIIDLIIGKTVFK